MKKQRNNLLASVTEVSLEYAADIWLKKVKINKKYSTYVKYRNIYLKYLQPIFAGGGDISGNLKEKIFSKTDLSDSYKRCIRTVLKEIEKQAALYGMPGIDIEVPETKRRDKRVEIFNVFEQADLLKYLYKDMDVYKMGIVLCMSTGLRLGEICALKQSNIDLNCKLIRINSTVQRIATDSGSKKTILLETSPKSDSSIREIPLSDECIRLLMNFRTDKKYLLGGDKPLEPRTYQYKFKNYLRNAGITEKNFHVLRHTFASNCISNGADVKSVSEIMGHSDVRITLNRYMHPSMELKREHMNVLSDIYEKYRGGK